MQASQGGSWESGKAAGTLVWPTSTGGEANNRETVGPTCRALWPVVRTGLSSR